MIIIILGVWMAFRILRLYIAPWLFKKGIEKMQEEARSQMGGQQRKQARPGRKEGEVTIEYPKDPSKKKSGDDSGEYVDFEEIKE